jgi:hypothetical protein
MSNLGIRQDSIGSPKRFNDAVNDIIRLAGFLIEPAGSIQVYRRNPAIKFIQDNEKINYCDTFKDGAITSATITNSDFIKLTGDLYPEGRGLAWLPALDALKLQIMQNTDYGQIQPLPITFFRKMEKKDFKKLQEGYVLYEGSPVSLPPNIKYAIQESGYAPHQLNKTLEICITPASYFDPAGRSKLGDPNTFKYDASGAVLPDIIFESLGFKQGIKNCSGLINDTKQCEITIQLSGGQFKTIRKADFTHMAPGPDYFLGNDEKNAEIKNPRVDTDTKKKYLLFKELGDTLQVVYAKLLMGGETDLSVCVFTGDDTVTARCRELGVPVCAQLNKREKNEPKYANLGRTLYYPHKTANPADLYPDIMTQDYSNCQNINKETIETITQYIENNIFKLPGIKLTDASKTYLQRIINNINKANEMFTPIYEYYRTKLLKELNVDTQFEILNTFKKIALAYTTIPNIINVEELGNNRKKIKQYEINPNIKYLFTSSELQEIKLEDAIRSGNGSFLEQLKVTQGQRSNRSSRFASAVNPIGQSGGTVKLPFMIEYYNLIEAILQKIGIENNSIIQDALKKMDGDEIPTIDNLAYSFICISYIFFNYIGTSCLNEDVLTYFIKEFIISGMKEYTLERFEAEYNAIPIVKLEHDLNEFKSYILNKYNNSPRKEKEFIESIYPAILEIDSLERLSSFKATINYKYIRFIGSHSRSSRSLKVRVKGKTRFTKRRSFKPVSVLHQALKKGTKGKTLHRTFNQLLKQQLSAVPEEELVTPPKASNEMLE